MRKGPNQIENIFMWSNSLIINKKEISKNKDYHLQNHLLSILTYSSELLTLYTKYDTRLGNVVLGRVEENSKRFELVVLSYSSARRN